MNARRVLTALAAVALTYVLMLIIPAYGQGSPAALLLALAIGILVGSILPSRRQPEGGAAPAPAANRNRLEALYYTAIRLAANLDLEAVLDTLLEALQRVFTYENGSILLVDEESGDLILARAHNYQLPPGYRVPAGRGITGRVVRTRRAEIVDDVTRDPDYIPGVRAGRSEICVPVLRGERVLAVINIESTVPHAFGPEDLFVLTSLAEIAALAIDNARLHGETLKLALTDGVTGLYNYRFCLECLQEQLRISQKAGKPLTLMMIDLDHFKRVNDRYGHITGDAVLRQFGEVLKSNVRESDYVCRYGGEEFCIILPGTDSHHALELADRLRRSLHHHTFVDVHGVPLETRITASIGIATFPEHARNEADLRRAADQALYKVKKEGRDAVASAPAVSEGSS